MAGIQSAVFMTCWQLRNSPNYLRIWSWFGINRFLWKSLSLLGGFWGIVYLPKITWQTVAFFLWRRGCVSLDAGTLKMWITMFLSCPTFGALWPLVRAWLGVVGVDSQSVSDHFLQFINHAGCSRSRRSFFHLIWLQCVWVLWNERNDRIFRNKQSSLPHMLNKVKSSSLWWLKANNVVFSFGIHIWWSSPLSCLGIDWHVCNLDRILTFSWLFWHTFCCTNHVVRGNIIHFSF